MNDTDATGIVIVTWWIFDMKYSNLINTVAHIMKWL